jgi:hypothetical protein
MLNISKKLLHFFAIALSIFFEKMAKQNSFYTHKMVSPMVIKIYLLRINQYL